MQSLVLQSLLALRQLLLLVEEVADVVAEESGVAGLGRALCVHRTVQLAGRVHLRAKIVSSRKISLLPEAWTLSECPQGVADVLEGVEASVQGVIIVLPWVLELRPHAVDGLRLGVAELYGLQV